MGFEKRKTWLNELPPGRVVMLDGATGTELVKRGMPVGVSPEIWSLEHPEAAAEIAEAYIEAGSSIVYVPSFGGNRVKLAEFGREKDVAAINRELAENCRRAVKGRVRCLGDLSPTGLFAEPCGKLKFDELIEIYREQAAALLAGGVDGFVAETMFDLQEARAAVLAVRSLTELPLFVTMTFEHGSGRTLNGTPPVAALALLQEMGADVFGCNCSSGPQEMEKLIREMKPYARIPLLAKPNAGLPRLKDGRTEFTMDASSFADAVVPLVGAGASFIGGCCGTSPEYIRLASEALKNISPPGIEQCKRSVVCSSRSWCEIDSSGVKVIGERLNPTGKKQLQSELREGKLDSVRRLAAEQQRAGAALLDVNCGLSGVDEKTMLCRIVGELSCCSELPLCIDSGDPAAVEAALRLYPGRALLNSIPAEEGKLKALLPIARRYGAMFIALPLSEEGIPQTAEKRLALAEKIASAAAEYGFEKADMVMDVLVMTAAADDSAPQTAIRTQQAAASAGWRTVCGVSNVSFGLPEREKLNSAMLLLLASGGLSMVIANPSSALTMDMLCAGELISGRDSKCLKYTRRFAGLAPASPSGTPASCGSAEISPLEAVRAAVIDGDSAGVEKSVNEALKSCQAQEIVDKALIPAVNQAGEFFDRKKFFLPQLVMSADAMRCGFAVLEPLLRKDASPSDAESAAGPEVVLATVEGDIHDIGKNIVGLMLKNYGFEVTDLGKDVAASDIISAAERENAAIIGLSALMTTTMPRMREVIELAKERRCRAKIIVGGAVVDQHYADEIGADGYSADAVAAVRLAQRLLCGDDE